MVREINSLSCVVKGGKTDLLFSANRLRGQVLYLCTCAYPSVLKREENCLNFKDSMGKRVSIN